MQKTTIWNLDELLEEQFKCITEEKESEIEKENNISSNEQMSNPNEDKKENEKGIEERADSFSVRFNEAITNTNLEKFLVNELAGNISNKRIAEKMSCFSRLVP